MKKLSIASFGWLIAGVIAVIVGVVLYKTLPMLGNYYMLLGIVAIVIGVAIVKVVEQYRQVALKKRRVRKRSS